MKKNTNDLKKEIQKYLKKKKVNFKGKLIFLLVNGIIIGTLVLSPNIKLNNNQDTTSENTVNYVSNTNIKIPEIKKNNIKETEKQENISVDTPVQTNTNQKENKIEQPKKETPKKEEPKKQSPAKNAQSSASSDITITLQRSNGKIITLNLEEYLIGVVGAEMPASFHIEALKAQAIAARTYALKRISEGIILTDTVKHQVYHDNEQLKSIWGNSYTTYYNKVKSAVESTKGKTLKYNGEYISAMYHSTNNGKTESYKDVFGSHVPYLVSVESPWDLDAPSYKREIEKSIEEINRVLNLNINENTNIEIIKRTEGNNIAVAKIEGKEYSGVEIRQLLGLRSADFDFSINGSTIKITTRGYGHGVGMSQYGANGMAKAGYTYDQILKHYYTNITIN